MDKTAKTKAVARHKAKTVKYPTKTSINMMTCGLPQHTGRTLGIGVCLIALLVAFVVKVGGAADPEYHWRQRPRCR